MKKLTVLFSFLLLVCFNDTLLAQQPWLTGGNSIGIGGTTTLGTTNSKPLQFIVNSYQAMVILANGNVGIGTTDPHYTLQVVGDVVDSGSFFATNIATSNSISVGQFRIVDGVIDSIVSPAGILQLSAASVNANGTFTAEQTITAGTSDTAITINGDAGTITSGLQKVSFGNDTIVTTGAVKMGNMNVAGTMVLAADTTSIDTSKRFMLLYPNGSVYSLDVNAVMSALSNPAPLGNDCGTSTFHPAWNMSASGLYEVPIWVNQCTYVGVGTGTPDAPLNISNENVTTQFSVTTPNTTTDVFTIDKSGNTYAAGNVGIGTTTPVTPLQIGQSNNSILFGGAGSIINYTNPGFNTIQSYIGFNLYSNGSGNWQTSNTLGGDAILTDENGYMNFVCWPGGGAVPDNLMQQETSMVVSPHGVVIRDNNGYSNGTPTCFFDPVKIITQNPNLNSNYLFFVSGSMYAQELLIQPCGWCDYVFDTEYKLTSLNDLEKYIIENKHLPDVSSTKEVEKNGIKVGDMDATMIKKIEELTLYIIQQQKQINAMNEEINELKRNSK